MTNPQIYYSPTNGAVNNFSAQFLKEKNEKGRYTFSDPSSKSDIFTLANAFLSFESMTNKKLQKLCYYAKAWYLAIYDENIIPESFQAWVHGAVNPELYHRFKEYGFEKIPQVRNTRDIPEEFLSFAKEVYDAYGHLSGDELESLNHQEEPWIKAREGYKPWENSNVIISENDMKEYYRKMIE